jgi:isoquinoline 1-oxidoreductase beta subunit
MIFVTNDLSRRGFLRTGATVGGGLLLSLSLPLGHGDAEPVTVFTPNTFIRIGDDGVVVLTMPSVEMGLGTYTSIPMLIAEELEVDFTQIVLEHAPANHKLHGNLLLSGVRATGGSTAIRASWMPLRLTGAIARTMLVTAAALRWNVDPATCQARRGEVIHTPSGRRTGYGEVAGLAGRLPAPETVALKRPEDFKLIGKPAKRLDTPANVNGTAVLNDAPTIEVYFVPGNELPGAKGEPGTLAPGSGAPGSGPPGSGAILPAVANAVFAATGTPRASNRSAPNR